MWLRCEEKKSNFYLVIDTILNSLLGTSTETHTHTHIQTLDFYVGLYGVS